LSLDMLGRPTHLSKELSALLSSHTGQQESALSSPRGSLRGTSAGDGDARPNTRKTKKPKEWSDYTSIDSSAAVAAAAISEHGVPSTVESSAHSIATSKKPRVAVLKRKRSSNTSDTEARGTTAADDSLGSLGRTSTAAGATSASLHSEDAEEETHVSATYSRSKVVAAKERRRERNKVLARKTRVKKKVELETLREQVTLLRVENERLKSLVRSKLPTHVGANLLVECDIKLPDNVAMFVQSIVDKVEVSHGHIFEKLRTAQRSFCISNANGAYSFSFSPVSSHLRPPNSISPLLTLYYSSRSTHCLCIPRLRRAHGVPRRRDSRPQLSVYAGRGDRPRGGRQVAARHRAGQGGERDAA
jgi:hypothetical protein